jgi:hypothetical protein
MEMTHPLSLIMAAGILLIIVGVDSEYGGSGSITRATSCFLERASFRLKQ